MAIGLAKELTRIGIEEEVTEGTYVAPSADTSYVAPLDGGFSITPAKELKERNILTVGFQKVRPRTGLRSVEATLNVEARGSGVEGGETDFHPLMKNMLGNTRTLAARKTSGISHTTSRIFFATTAGLNVGDVVVVLESGAHHVSPITAVVLDTHIDLLVPAGSAFTDNVEVAKNVTYFGSNTLTDFKALSLSFYQGNEILESAIGVRPNALSLSNFTTGEIASFDFTMSGLDFDRSDASAPHTPVYDDETPPLILGACVYKNGVERKVNNFSFSVEHETSFLTATCEPAGRIAGRKSGKRNVTGSFDPYADDTDVSDFDDFKNDTPYSVFAFAANPSAVAGEYDLGSVFGVYMPNCLTTADAFGENEGVLTNEVEFSSDGGTGGTENEIYISFI